jgi:hypothetical protein
VVGLPWSGLVGRVQLGTDALVAEVVTAPTLGAVHRQLLAYDYFRLCALTDACTARAVWSPQTPSAF